MNRAASTLRQSPDRPGVLAEVPPSAIRKQQVLDGHEPCFGTEQRYNCAETECPWRKPCQRLRAAWLR